ncbi:MAG: sugar phosphate isomerase/epimerase [Planctomycetes bacterium]|nr:sugar phosphate isomerase/epimerase [Planctomycetota bacterium]MBI3832758.1 sugar phosphate isomerase/epimerase [Planctomycetota bacterium]
MLLGYNTNGFAHHSLEDAFSIIHEIGYRAVALTIEKDLLDPPDSRGLSRAVAGLRPLLTRFPMRLTIETGSRFLLDPRRKHQPTLLSGSSEGRRTRLEFLKAAVDLAAETNAACVSLWSGSADDGAPQAECFDRLRRGLDDLLIHADRRKVRLAFEPEPGMFVETMAQFEELHDAMNHPRFGLTLDVGHVHCLSDGDVAAHVHRWRDRLWNVHIEDMRRGTHEHLMFGDGDMDVAGAINALAAIQYSGPVHIELSRHSHDAVNVAQAAYDFLSKKLERQEN